MSESGKPDGRRGNADPLLVFLINLASNGDLELQISLQVRGALVTGRIISLRDYASRFAEDFAGSFSLPSHVADSIRNDMRLVFGLDDGRLEEATKDSTAARYIHLEDAIVLVGSGAAKEAGLWRGRLKEIDGFWLHGASIIERRPRRVLKEDPHH